MAVASYMDFFGYRIQGDSFNGTIEIDYRVKYDKPIVTATVAYDVEGDMVNFGVRDMGRKVRVTKAEQERHWEVLRVARNYWRLFIADPVANRERVYKRAS